MTATHTWSPTRSESVAFVRTYLPSSIRPTVPCSGNGAGTDGGAAHRTESAVTVVTVARWVEPSSSATRCAPAAGSASGCATGSGGSSDGSSDPYTRTSWANASSSAVVYSSPSLFLSEHTSCVRRSAWTAASAEPLLGNQTTHVSDFGRPFLAGCVCTRSLTAQDMASKCVTGRVIRGKQQ
jgi:hypothetical protein